MSDPQNFLVSVRRAEQRNFLVRDQNSEVDYYFSEGMFLETYRSANGYMQNVLNFLFLMNGGGIISLLTYLGGRNTVPVNVAAGGLSSFALGSALAFCASMIAYFTQRSAAQEIRRRKGEFKLSSVKVCLFFGILGFSFAAFLIAPGSV